MLGTVPSIVFICMCGVVFVCVYVDVCASAQDGQKRASDPLGLESHADVRCPSVWCWRLNSALLEEQQALLTAEPSLQVSLSFLKQGSQ